MHKARYDIKKPRRMKTGDLPINEDLPNPHFG